MKKFSLFFFLTSFFLLSSHACADITLGEPIWDFSEDSSTGFECQIPINLNTKIQLPLARRGRSRRVAHINHLRVNVVPLDGQSLSSQCEDADEPKGCIKDFRYRRRAFHSNQRRRDTTNDIILNSILEIDRYHCIDDVLFIQNLLRGNYLVIIEAHSDNPKADIPNEQKNPVAMIEVSVPEPLDPLKNTTPFHVENDDDCPVCLSELKGRKARKLPCGHIFCEHCLDCWALSHTHPDDLTCPYCRQNF